MILFAVVEHQFKDREYHYDENRDIMTKGYFDRLICLTSNLEKAKTLVEQYKGTKEDYQIIYHNEEKKAWGYVNEHTEKLGVF